MKEMFFDLVKQNKNLRLKLNKLNEKYNQYCFEDQFVCDIILEEYRRTEEKMKKVALAIQSARNIITKEELKAWKAEFNAMEVVA